MYRLGRGGTVRGCFSKKVMGGLFFFALFSAFFGAGAPRSGEGESRVLLAAAGEQEKETFFELTQEEEHYLAGLRGQTLFVGISGSGIWEFFDGVDCGPAAPLADVLHYEFGLEIKMVQGSWEENRVAMQDGGLDLLVGVPAVHPDGAGDAGSRVLPESGLYCSAWLYENPYVVVKRAAFLGKDGADGKAPDEEGRAVFMGKDGADGKAPDEEGCAVFLPEESGGRREGRLAYVAGDPVCETLIPHISGALGLYIEGADFADGAEFFPCTDEDAVFSMLQSGQADAGILPEEALFLRYPLPGFFVAVRLGAYGSRVAVGAADQRLLPLLEILDRYLETTQEGDALREAMRAQQQGIRERKIREQEGDILLELQARGRALQYAQAGLDAVPFFWHDENGAYGELPDFLDFVSGCTGLVFCESALSGEKVMQALEDGELLFAAGIPFIGAEWAYCPAAGQGERLVLVIPKADAGQFAGVQDERGAIARRYWGVVQGLMPLLAGTEFDGHVVGFTDERALYEAMRAGEIGGMLITQGSLDALLLSGEDAYAAAGDIAFMVRSGLTFSEVDRAAAEFFGRLWQFYSLFNREQKSAAGQYRMAYAQASGRQEGWRKEIWVLRGALLVLAAAFLLSRRRAGKGAGAKRRA